MSRVCDDRFVVEIYTYSHGWAVDNASMDLYADIPLLMFYAANSCYALAYTVRNMLVLRTLTVIAALLTFPYFIFQQEILYSALLWQSIFALVNIVNILCLVLERRPVKLTRQQQHLKDLVFRHFTNREMLKILSYATPHSATKGQTLIDCDSRIDSLYLLCSGRVDVVTDGRFLARRRPGAFLGEVHFMTGERTTADVVFSEDGSYLRWDAADLRDLLDKNQSLGKAFDSMLTIDVARKLRRNNADDSNRNLVERPTRQYPSAALPAN